jgi:predicted nuclease of predicted toxin-antitoxin system
MKVLLDENLPKKLKQHFSPHAAFTVSDMEWNSKKNGELLSLMMNNDFEAFLTFDQNIAHQQNFSTYPIKVIILIAPINTYEVLKNLVPKINECLQNNHPEVIIIT